MAVAQIFYTVKKLRNYREYRDWAVPYLCSPTLTCIKKNAFRVTHETHDAPFVFVVRRLIKKDKIIYHTLRV